MSTDAIAGVGRRRSRRIDRLTDAFYPLYQRLFDENGSFVVGLERKLAEARMDKTVGLYLSRALAFGVVSGVLLWLLGIVVGLVLFGANLVEVGTLTGLRVPSGTVLTLIEMARIPFLIFTSGLVFGTIGFAGVFGTYVLVPYSRSARRRREIDLLLPDAVSFMYALSIGGMNQLEIIEAMANAEDTYGEVSREFRTIVQETQYFDTDYRSSIRKQAAQTPSSDLSQFLTDMLSIIDSGGNMTEFLDDKKDIHFRTAKEKQQRILDSLELFSEIYITISLFPLLLIIILVIMNMIGGVEDLMLYGTVYVMIPVLGVAFLILVATVRQDELGDGYLEIDDGAQRFEEKADSGLLNRGLIQEFTGTYYIFDRIKNREGTHETIRLLKRPHLFFRDHPLYTLAITVPAALVLVIMAVVTGAVARSWSSVVAYPVWSTFVYVYLPLFVICVPLAVFWEWNVRSRRAVLDDLSANLRKLASANATGLTLLESVKVVGDTSPGKLGDEFRKMYAKSTYGMHLKESLIVFNNKYHIPRLARTVKLVSKAQEISSEISPVLSTAAKATEVQEDIERERKSRARLQVAIIILTFVTLLGVMAVMKSQFVDVMGELTQQTGATDDVAGQQFGGSVDLDLLSLLFFHAVTLQAIVSGLVCGYIRDASLASGVKYVVALLGTSLVVWVMVA